MEEKTHSNDNCVLMVIYRNFADVAVGINIVFMGNKYMSHCTKCMSHNHEANVFICSQSYACLLQNALYCTNNIMFVSAVHFAPYLTVLSRMMLI